MNPARDAMKPPSERLVRMMPHHADAVAELHYKYTESLIRDLGRRMCHVFYEDAMKNKNMVGHVYLIGSEVVGFAIGTTDNTNIFSSFRVKFHIILSLLLKPHLIRKVFSHHKNISTATAEALYSAVEEKHRAKKIAMKLYQAAYNDFRKRGIKYIESFVDADNKPALTMCKFTGWKVKEEFHLNGKRKYRLYSTLD